MAAHRGGGIESISDRGELTVAEAATAREYLKAARDHLGRGGSKGLAGAADALRKGIKARERDQEQAYEAVKKQKRKGWRVAQLGIKLEQAYKAGESAIEISLFESEPERTVAAVYLTPVSPALQARKSTLKSLARKFAAADRADPEAVLEEPRDFLEQTWAELEQATRGTLLAPPMMNKKGTRMHLEVEEGDPQAQTLAAAMDLVGVRYKLHARQVEEAPAGRMSPA